MPEKLTGGCQCGAVRFEVTAVGRAAICHCRMCQKAFGSAFGPLVTAHEMRWMRGAPRLFRSSNLAQRGFCAECGTPLCYWQDGNAIELAIGAFDDPDAVPPVVQFNINDKLGFFDGLASLPPQPAPDKEQAWNSRIVSYQHPDRDSVVWPPEEFSHA